MTMRRFRSVFVFLIVLPLLAGGVRAEQLQRLVVLDGDTIELDGRVIDLAGIDAPEFGQRCRRGETDVDCGMIARTQLLDLTAAAEVICDLDEVARRAGWPTVAVCRAGGYDLSEGMLHTGWALADPEATPPARYAQVLSQARDAGRGLWGFDFVDPWDWRRGSRLAVSDQR